MFEFIRYTAKPVLLVALTFLPPPQAIEAVQLSWAFCENCLSVFCEFFHSMMTVLLRWVPLCFLQGRSGRGGLFWALFWAVAKKCLARGARTAMPNQESTVNIRQRIPKDHYTSKRARGINSAPTGKNRRLDE
jgi:hypothetical protein